MDGMLDIGLASKPFSFKGYDPTSLMLSGGSGRDSKAIKEGLNEFYSALTEQVGELLGDEVLNKRDEILAQSMSWVAQKQIQTKEAFDRTKQGISELPQAISKKAGELKSKALNMASSAKEAYDNEVAMSGGAFNIPVNMMLAGGVGMMSGVKSAFSQVKNMASQKWSKKEISNTPEGETAIEPESTTLEDIFRSNGESTEDLLKQSLIWHKRNGLANEFSMQSLHGLAQAQGIGQGTPIGYAAFAVGGGILGNAFGGATQQSAPEPKMDPVQRNVFGQMLSYFTYMNELIRDKYFDIMRTMAETGTKMRESSGGIFSFLISLFLLTLLDPSGQMIAGFITMIGNFILMFLSMMAERLPQMIETFINIFTVIAPAILMVFVKIAYILGTKIIEYFTDAWDKFKSGDIKGGLTSALSGIALIFVAVYALSYVFTGLSFAMKGVSMLFSMLGGALSFLFSPIGLIIALVVGLGALIWAFMPEGDKEAIIKLFKEWAGAIGDFFSALFSGDSDRLKETGAVLWEKTKQLFSAIGDGIASVFKTFVYWVYGSIYPSLTRLGLKWDTMIFAMQQGFLNFYNSLPWTKKTNNLSHLSMGETESLAKTLYTVNSSLQEAQTLFTAQNLTEGQKARRNQIYSSIKDNPGARQALATLSRGGSGGFDPTKQNAEGSVNGFATFGAINSKKNLSKDRTSIENNFTSTLKRDADRIIEKEISGSEARKVLVSGSDIQNTGNNKSSK